MELPPGPRSPWPVQTTRWLFWPHEFLSECQARHGDTFKLEVWQIGTVVVVCSPEAIKEVMTGDPSVFHAGEANTILKPLLGPSSLLLLDDAEHIRQRRVLLPPFHGERMQSYAATMRDVTLASLARWPRGRAFALHPRMQHITLEVILRNVFGIGDAAALAGLGARLAEILDTGSKMPRALPLLLGFDLFKLLPGSGPGKLKRQVDAEIFAEIARRREEPRGEDVLSLLLDARHEDGAPLGDDELRDELVTLLAAGHETTATALAWTFERLAMHPAALRRVEDEVLSVVGDGPVGPEHLPRLDYVDAVIKESLRVRPIIAMVARKLTQPVTIAGYDLPRGAIVAPCIALVHRRPEIYPEPERFRPERWLGVKPDPYAWLPFGGSTRRCLGMAFALYEMKMVVATVISQLRILPAQGHDEPAARRGITFAPQRGAPVIVEPRLPAGKVSQRAA